MINLNSFLLIQKVFELMISNLHELCILNMLIGFDHMVDGLHIWERGCMIVLDQVLNQHRVLPVHCNDIQTEVAVDKGW